MNIVYDLLSIGSRLLRHCQALISIPFAVAIAIVLTSLNAMAQVHIQQIEEILVTATKKGTAVNVQDVPTAITAFGEEQLRRANFRNLQSLSFSIPNVQLDTIGSTPGFQNFSIRGLGITTSIPSIDPTVGVFIDGVYMGYGGGVVFDNFDLAGIEVLRGPQGVLFGRNVTGGAVLVRTRKPSFEPFVNARLGVETGLNKTADATLSGTLVENRLAGKLAVYGNIDDGWFKNDFTGSEFGASDTWIVRPALLYTPTDDLEFILRTERGRRNSDGAVYQNPSIVSRDSFDINLDEEGFSDDEWSTIFLETNWRVPFGDGTVTNVFGWREFEALTFFDPDGTPMPSFHAVFATDQEQFSNELRYTGDFGRFSVTTGLYYFTQDIFYIEERFIFDGAVEVAGGGEQDSSTWGGFGAFDFSLTDSLTLNVGLRYTSEKKDVNIAQISPAGCVRASSTCNFTFNDDESWSNISPKIGFQWKLNDETQFYGYWAKGFRSGGYNLRLTSDLNSPGPVDSEEQSSFEIGLKTDFADGRGRLNLAGFYNVVDDIQREVNIPGPFGVSQNLTNIGKLEIKGVEAEMQFLLTDGLTVAAHAGYLEGEYDDLLFDLSGDGVIDDKDFGLEAPRLAPWTYGISLTHEIIVAQAGRFATSINFNHRDRSFFADNNTSFLEAVDSLDANLAYTANSEKWQLTLYGKNLLDESYYNATAQLPDIPAFGGDGAGPKPVPESATQNKGRVIGAELRVWF